ncbi:MAG: serine/threonine-protein kinase, partial [Myxococcota bacterium]
MGHADNVLGRYRLVAELGRGGMADVFLAMALGPAGFNKLIVLKRLREELLEEGDFLRMFLDEARLAAKLHHPNIVQTIEVGEANGNHFICMEYLAGQPLNRIFRRCPEITVAMRAQILCEALAGLHYAHELVDFDGSQLDIVHRDATPHNIFLTYNGEVKVVDFGIAKAASSTAETKTGVLKGKVSYMPPEQARAERVDRRADVFTIGSCLWEAAAGQRVWKGTSDLQVLDALMGRLDCIPSVTTLVPNLDPAMVAIIDKALALDPDDRYPTAQAMRDELRDYLVRNQLWVPAEELGKLVGARFQRERTKLQGLIEQQVRQASATPTGAYASVALPRISPPSIPPGEDGGSGDYMGSHSGPFDPHIQRAELSSSLPRVASVPPPGGETFGAVTASDLISVPKPSRAKPIALTVGLVAVVCIAGATLAWPSGSEPPAPATSASAS